MGLIKEIYRFDEGLHILVGVEVAGIDDIGLLELVFI